jgi:NAD(P)-dependent dehydrogenase (short-subunit alcohol dehydrogenase family)
MKEKGGGAIVKTSSLFGVMGYATTATYCASKWGVLGLTKSVALEVARKNIRVNAICPGSTMTPLLTGMFGGEQAARDTVLPSLPMGGIADPMEIAGLVLFLASDGASFITGEGVVIGGGGFVAGSGRRRLTSRSLGASGFL